MDDRRIVGWVSSVLVGLLLAVAVGIPSGFAVLVLIQSSNAGLWLGAFPIGVGLLGIAISRTWRTSTRRRATVLVSAGATLLVADVLIVFGGLRPQSKCTWEFSKEIAANTEVASGLPLADDGKGQYSDAVDGVDTFIKHSLKLAMYEPGLRVPKQTARRLLLDLSKPVPGSGAVPLGVVPGVAEFKAYWYQDSAGMVRTVHAIPAGTTVTSDRTDIRFDLNGRTHRLTMGWWRTAYCDAEPGIHGSGTSDARISRQGPEEYTAEAPPGSTARLWDVSGSTPKDKGLYYFTFRVRFAAKR